MGITGAIDSIGNGCSAYIREIPDDWAVETVKGFVVGFIVGTVITANPIAGLTCGSLSAIASAVHAAVTPLFKFLNGGSDRDLSWSQELLRGCFSFVAAGCVAAACGDPIMISSVAFFAIIHGIRAIVDEPLRSTRHASWLVV